MELHDGLMGAIWRSTELIEDFEALADCGGRFCGTDSEARARAFLRERLRAVGRATYGELAFPYDGWRCRHRRLTLLDPTPREAPCHALLWAADTPPGGLEAEVADAGRGLRHDIEALGRAARGRVLLARQDYPFGSDTVHRMVKYRWAREAGAVGFLLANPNPGEGLATGYCADRAADDIPAAGIDYETAAALAAPAVGRRPRVRLEIAGVRFAAESINLIAEVPGMGPEWVVLCAHYDGHDLAESALDNATGAVAVVEILRRFAPHAQKLPRGLRAMLFTTEEWGLLGSRRYVEGLSADERAAIAAVINLDTIAGSPNLFCLTSGFAGLDEFVAAVARDSGQRLDTVAPLKRNSDHYNFACAGVPALRLVAGFDEPGSTVHHILTPGDTRDKVSPTALKAGTLAAAALVWRALGWPGPIARHKTAAEVEDLLRTLP